MGKQQAEGLLAWIGVTSVIGLESWAFWPSSKERSPDHVNSAT